MVIIILLALVLLVIVLIMINGKNTYKNAQQKLDAIIANNNLTINYSLFTYDDCIKRYYVIGICGNDVIIVYDNNEIRRIPFSHIISSEYIVNNSSVSKKDGAIGRALVGGVLAGGIGAIVGASSADVNTITSINSAKVHVMLRNEKEISIDFVLWNTTTDNQAIIKNINERGSKIMDIFTYAIDVKKQ